MSQETRTVALRRLTPLALALSLFAPARVRSAEGDVRIGAVLPLTGKESAAGGAYKQGTEFAVKEINDSGGIAVGDKKLKIDLTLFDDATDAAKSAQLVEQLVRQTKVHAIIGGYTSPIVQAESVVADEYGVPFISGGAAALSIYSRSKWVFGTLSPVSILSSTQMLFLDSLIAAGKLKKPLKIALITENTEHGRDYAEGVRNFVATHANTYSIAFEESFDLYTPDFRPVLTRLAAAKADVLMADAHLEDYISMHRTYTQMGLSHQMVTYGARGADASARKALGSAADYIFASGWWSDLLPYPQVKAFNARWKAATGTEPEWYHACAYETVRALAVAIQKAGSLEPEAIRAALASLKLTDSILPGGVLRFSNSGQAILPFVVTQNKPGDEVDIVWPPSSRTGEAVAPIPR